MSLVFPQNRGSSKRSSNIPGSGSLGVSLDGRVNSLRGTTGPGVPKAMKKRLEEMQIEIQEDADTFFGSAKAVESLEKKCGWDPLKSDFADPECFKNLEFDAGDPQLDLADPREMDIVIPSIRNLDFLEYWREFFQGFHVILVQDGDPEKKLKVPEWVDYELYNRHDIEKALGDSQWIISSRDASIRNFGFLLSKKRYVYTIDDDCLPALDQNGFKINPLALHLRNLRSPSIPYFFNTLYDPYVNGSDFVRGYPYSLRSGVATAVSHGIWLNAPDYDAPTQLLKPRERNTRFLDVTLTVPYGQLYPMCSMNVAFDRQLIGPAFMQGLMGDGQPWARYDDMFAGWASKVVADHLRVGVKSGQPYVRHNKASNPFTNLKKEYKGLWWQEQIIGFLQTIRLNSKPNEGAAAAYVDLANQIEAEFGTKLHPYFKRLAEAMRVWAHVWQRASNGQIQFVPSQQQSSSLQPINLASRSKEMAMKSDDFKPIVDQTPEKPPGGVRRVNTSGKVDAAPTPAVETAVKTTVPEVPAPAPAEVPAVAPTEVPAVAPAEVPAVAPVAAEVPVSEIPSEESGYAQKLAADIRKLRTDPSRSIVCEEDRSVGRLWKTYVYPLSSGFNIGPLRKVIHDGKDRNACLISGCPNIIHDKYAEYNAEAIVLLKLLEALHFTENPKEADLILVPALPALYLHQCSRGDNTNFFCDKGACPCKWFDKLKRHMRYFSEDPASKSTRHLLLFSQDSLYTGPDWMKNMIFGRTQHFFGTYGPGNLVIPSLNTKAFAISKVKSYEERSIFLLAQFRVRYKDRISAAAQLKAYNGTKKVVKDDFTHYQRNHPEYLGDSIFNLCLPGDLPYQKRFYDTLLNGAIPVVIARKYPDGVKVHWQTNKNPHFQFPKKPALYAAERSYPRVEEFGGISNFILEVPGPIFEAGQLMDFLEKVPEATIREKMQLIQQHRMLFGYDFNGTQPDAVTSILHDLAKRLGKSS